jgi:hypothetical protein
VSIVKSDENNHQTVKSDENNHQTDSENGYVILDLEMEGLLWTIL